MTTELSETSPTLVLSSISEKVGAMFRPEVDPAQKVDLSSLEKEMLSAPQAECPVLHHFSDGIYIREMRVKAGVMLIGHWQKSKHMNVFVKGKVAMYSDEGVTVLTAPMTMEANPGKKVGYIIEDMAWLNIYPNESNETDIDVLEARWMDKSKSEGDGQEEPVLEEERAHYLETIESLGLSEELVSGMSGISDDLIPFPNHYLQRVAVRDSQRHGRGLFASAGFEEGETICPARLKERRTPAGRYTNHSKHPNAKFKKMPNGDIYLVAKENILPCMGGGRGTEITVCYRQAIEENLR